MSTESRSQFCRIQKAALLCFVLASLSLPVLAVPDDWKYEETHQDVRGFVSGGSIHVHMTVGDLRIRRGDSDKIRLEYTVKSKNERNVKDAHVEFGIHGKDATIEFHSPSSGNTNFDVTLEIPQSTNLDVHEKVGDLRVENIEGDKYLDLGVGDIRVANEKARYRLINASAGIGDVDSPGYGETSGWLGKTLRYHGDGKYELRAHVGVGDIHLE
jgi:Putative adhesin